MSGRGPSSRGWYVEVENPGTGHVFEPDVIGDPTRVPRTNGHPRIEIPVRKRPRWRQLIERYPEADIPLRIWFNGKLQPIDTLESVGTDAGKNILKGRGGVELDNRATRSIQQKKKHILAEELITNNTPYAANVDAPPTNTRENQTILTVDDQGSWEGFMGTPNATDAWNVTAGTLEPNQVNWLTDASGISNIAASDGSAQQIVSSIQDVEHTFSSTYEIPDGNVLLYYRTHYQSIGDWSNINGVTWGATGYETLVDGAQVNDYSGTFQRGYVPQEGAYNNQRKAFAYNSSTGTATEETAASNDEVSNDMTLLPSSPSVGDEYYWATRLGNEFDEIDLQISQVGSGTWSIVWEYYAEEVDGSGNVIASGWREIPNVFDGTNGFRSSGVVNWSLNDIQTDTQNGGDHVRMATDSGNTGDPEVYVRARLTSFSSLSSQPLGRRSRCRGGPMVWETESVSGSLPGGTHTIEVNGLNQDGEAFAVDVLGLRDTRFTYTEPSSLNSDGYLDGPELYPQELTVASQDEGTVQQVVGGRLESAWNDVSNAQAVALSNDQGATWTEATNTETIETDFGSGSTTLRARFSLSRFGDRANATPATGYENQTVDTVTLKADLSNVPIVIDRQFDGSVLSILNEIADPEYIWSVERNAAGDLEIQWTQPGQREAPEAVDVVENYNDEISKENVVDRAVVKGKSIRTRKEDWQASHGTAWDLNEDNIQTGTEVVYDADTGTQFTYGEDYVMDWNNGTITALASGALTDLETYQIDYEHRPVATYTRPNAPANPRVEVFDFAALSTNQACEQIAIQLVNELDDPLITANANLASSNVGWNVVEAIDLDSLPGSEPYEVKSIEQTPLGTSLSLESRQSIDDAVSSIRQRIQQVSSEL